jgi:MtN3 and saliva related transmembrane protein
MEFIATTLGALAACLTTTANVPQVLKCIRTGKSGDLSLKMLILLCSGLLLWLIYGLLRGDLLIVVANAISLALCGVLLVFKYRDKGETTQLGRSAPASVTQQARSRTRRPRTYRGPSAYKSARVTVMLPCGFRPNFAYCRAAISWIAERCFRNALRHRRRALRPRATPGPRA